jgi:hypothetical protein
MPNPPSPASRSTAIEEGVVLSFEPKSESGLLLGTFNSNMVVPFKRPSAKEPPTTITLEDNSPAILMVVNEDPDPTTNRKGVVAYTNRFYLTNVQRESKERMQIAETFGEAAVSFFDAQTRIYNFSGSLLENNTADKGSFTYRYLWASAFQKLYDDIARGSKLTQNKNIAVLSFENYLIYGWLANLVMAQNSAETTHQFSFSMVVRDHKFVKDDIDTLYSLEKQFIISEDHGLVVENLNLLITNTEADLIAANKRLSEEAANPADMDKTSHDKLMLALKEERDEYQKTLDDLIHDLTATTGKSSSIFDRIEYEDQETSTTAWPK